MVHKRNPTKNLRHGAPSDNTTDCCAPIFSDRDKPISHGDLVAELSDLHGDQATIYRTLVTFTEVGLLRVASKAEGITRYELVLENDDPQHVHPHFVCKHVVKSAVFQRDDGHHLTG